MAHHSRPVEIHIDKVQMVYSRRGGGKLDVISQLSLDVHEHEFLTIVGESGCGKSTLLNIIAGLLNPTAGRVLVDGQPVTGPGPDRTMVFQDDAVFPWYTVRQNIEYGLRIARKCKDAPNKQLPKTDGDQHRSGTGSKQPHARSGRRQRLSKAERDQRVNEFLQLTGLASSQNAYPRELSGGMRKRVDVARAAATAPRVLLMDEPFAALDVMTKEGLQLAFLDIWRKAQMTVVFVTHDIEEALFLSDRVMVMARHPGRVKRIVDVPYPRPRDTELKTEPAFQALRRELTRELHSNG